MRNFNDEEIKHKEAQEELKKDQEIIDLAHDTEVKKYGSQE